MEKHSGNTLSYAQLQRICAKNKPRGVKCAGKGVTKAYLHEKLSALGLLDGPGAPASDASLAPNTTEYLLSLSQDVREKIIKTYRTLAGLVVASTNPGSNTKRAMTGVAEAFADTPAWKITEYCAKIKDLCEDSFFEALFHDVYPDIYELFSKVPVSTDTKSFHDEYRPASIDKKESGKTGKRHYHFWEQLYAEIDSLISDEKKRKLLEDVLNERHVESEDSTVFQSYPFLSVYLGNTLPLFVEDVIVENDMDLYRYLDVPQTEMERYLLSGKPGIVSIVLSDGRVDPAARNNEAVRTASWNGHSEVVELLLADARVDPTVWDNFAIREASENGHADVVELLLRDPRVDPAAEDNDAILMASMFGRAEVVKKLLADRRVDPTVEDNAAIRSASGRGHAEAVELLLADGRVDPTVEDNEAILMASWNGHVEVVELLLRDPRVDPTARNNDTIRKASWFGHAEVVELLLADPRVDPTTDNNQAIRFASSKGHAGVVELLLRDPRVNPTAVYNEAIRNASRFNRAEVVKLLLADERVDPTAEDNEAIREASMFGHVEVVKLLLADKRTDPTAKNNEAIHKASRNGRVEVVKLLLADERVDPGVCRVRMSVVRYTH